MLVRTRCYDKQPALIALAKGVRAGKITRDQAFSAAREIAAIRDKKERVYGDKRVSASVPGLDVSTLFRREGRG